MGNLRHTQGVLTFRLRDRTLTRAATPRAFSVPEPDEYSSVLEAAEAAEKPFINAWDAAVDEAMQGFSVAIFKAQLATGSIDRALAMIPVEAYVQARKQRLTATLLDAAYAGAQVAADKLQGATIAIKRDDGSAPAQAAEEAEIPMYMDMRIAESMKVRVGDLIRGIDEPQRKAIEHTIRAAIYTGVSPDVISKVIDQILQVDTRMVEAIGRRMSTLPPNLNSNQVAGVLEMSLKGAASRRAATIQRTETLNATNLGQRFTWMQAMEDGLLRKDALVKWVTTPDDRLCKWCSKMANTSIQVFDDGFTRSDGQGIIEAPPLHPNCRCTVAITRLKVQEAKVKEVSPEPVDWTTAGTRDETVKKLKTSMKNLFPVRTPEIKLDFYLERGDLTVLERVQFHNASKSVAESYATFSEKGLRPPDTVRMISEPNNMAIAQTMLGQNQFIEVNASNTYWENPSKTKRDLFDSGFHSTPNPDAVMWHEMGHTLHLTHPKFNTYARTWPEVAEYEAVAQGKSISEVKGKDISRIQSLASTVSTYAATSPLEFVAEVFAAELDNRKQSNAVRELYELIGGPTLP